MLSNATNSSAGGGLAIFSCEGVIEMYGDVYADGAPGFGNGGGGSGGMILFLAQNVEGNGSLSVQGGAGGPLGGGGGGGGQLEVDIVGVSTTFYYDGIKNLTGGSALSATFQVDEVVYPQKGRDGVILWPFCPVGHGNNKTSLVFCKECPVGQVRNIVSR